MISTGNLILVVKNKVYNGNTVPAKLRKTALIASHPYDSPRIM